MPDDDDDNKFVPESFAAKKAPKKVVAENGGAGGFGGKGGSVGAGGSSPGFHVFMEAQLKNRGLFVKPVCNESNIIVEKKSMVSFVSQYLQEF